MSSVLLTAGLVTGVCEAAGERAAQLYEDASVRFAQGDLDAAIREARKALELEPGHLASRALLGRALLATGQPADAAAQLARASKGGADPELVLVPLATAYLLQGERDWLLREIPDDGHQPATDAALLILKGKARLQRNEFDQAAVAFERAAQLQPRTSAPLLGSAHVMLRRGNFDEAMALVERAVALEDGQAEPWYVKGVLEVQRGELEDGLASLTMALSLWSDHLPARSARAAALLQLGRDAEAVQDVIAVRQADPGDPQAAFLMALFLERLGERQLAHTALRNAAALLPSWRDSTVQNDPASLMLLAIVSLLDGARDRARVQLSRCVEIAPRHGGAGKLLGAIMLADGAVLEASEVLTVAANAIPRDPAVQALLGRAHARLGQHALAAAALERSVELAPSDAGVWVELARSRLELQRADDAVDALESALALDQGRTDAATLLIGLYLERDRVTAALRVSRLLLEARGSDPLALNLAGVVQMRLRDAGAARTLFQRAVTIDPGARAPRYNLGLLDFEAGDLETSGTRFQALLKEEPDDVRVLTQLARIALAESRYPAAARWMEKARTLAGNEKRFGLILTDIYLETGDVERAVSVGDDLETRYPADVDVLLANSRVALAQRDRVLAVSLLHRAAGVAGYSAPVLLDVAELFERAGETLEARYVLEKALQGDDQFIPAVVAAVYVDIRLGETAKALQRASALRAMSPALPMTQRVEGDALMAAGRFEEALERFRAAQAGDDRAEIAVRIFRAEHRTAPRQAITNLADWVRTHPAGLAARQVLAQVLIEDGQFQTAVEHYEAMLRDDPEDVALINNLALLYHETGDPRAVELARRALELAPDAPAVLDTMGWLLIETGEPDRGLSYLREARTRLSRHPQIGYHLAVAFERLGQHEKARREIEAVVSSGETFPQAAEAQALLRRLRVEKPLQATDTRPLDTVQ